MPIRKNIFLIFILLPLASCMNDDDFPAPRPKAYFRIDLPEKHYVTYDSTCPFRFQYPAYAAILDDKLKSAEPCWLNMDFPRFRARLHISYKKVENNIAEYLSHSRELAVKHQVKASSMEEKLVLKDSVKVYGLIYEFGGNTASALQFYLTDSTRHFLRGALYFNVRPNNDSIQPVYDFIKKDLEKMIETFSWKDTGR